MATNESRSRELEEDGLNRYNQQVNILRHQMERTYYVDALKSITSNPEVPYRNVLIGLAAGLVILVAFLVVLFQVIGFGPRFLYVGLPFIGLFITLAVGLIMYLIPSRKRSMLENGILMIYSIVIERIRRVGERATDVSTFGIDAYERGLFKFTNGDVGVMLEVEGIVSPSSIPSVANGITHMRLNHLKQRSNTSQEFMITSVRKVNLETQRRAMTRHYEKFKDSRNEKDRYRKQLAMNMHNYLVKLEDNNESVIKQYLIIRDVNNTELQRSLDRVKNAARSGLYARINVVKSRREVVEVLGPLVMLSKEGTETHAKESRVGLEKS